MEQRVELKAEDIINELKSIIADQAQEIAVLRVALSSNQTLSVKAPDDAA